MSEQQANGRDLAQIEPPRLPWHPGIEKRFGDIGVNQSTWRTLTDAIFPSAKSTSAIILALGYCKARELDPFKRPVNIVPMWDSKKKEYRETVWPSIHELRTTAHRTREYAGRDATKEGPKTEATFTGKVKDYSAGGRLVDKTATVRFPEWMEVTVYRVTHGLRCAYTARVYWLEAYGKHAGSDLPNDMWQRRSRGQLDKCTEAAALRMAFPEELGGEYSAEEMEGQAYEASPIETAASVSAENIPSAPTKSGPSRDADEAEVISEPGDEGEPDQKEDPPAKHSKSLAAFGKAAKASETRSALDHVWDMYDGKLSEAEAAIAAEIYDARIAEIGG